ncbi:uncharacterized protein [Palaemon carinicauda]|uniref:uncharacterized protein n=1 Tax=Palaemon carinicauda TaxID=392227 RepID=UPI0035B62178
MPSIVKALQEVLSMISYYHCFLPALSANFDTLYTSCKDKPKYPKGIPLQEAAFCSLKNALSIAAALTFPVQLGPLFSPTVTSNFAISAVLEQVVNGSPRWHPATLPLTVSFLAVHLPACHFCHFLEGIPFINHMDHMLLMHAFTQQYNALVTRQR